MSISSSMGRFIQTIRYTKPKKKGIHTHISRINGPGKYGVCDLTIDLDVPFIRVMLRMVRISSTVGYVILT